jgi:hypothetical protein
MYRNTASAVSGTYFRSERLIMPYDVALRVQNCHMLAKARAGGINSVS